MWTFCRCFRANADPATSKRAKDGRAPATRPPAFVEKTVQAGAWRDPSKLGVASVDNNKKIVKETGVATDSEQQLSVAFLHRREDEKDPQKRGVATVKKNNGAEEASTGSELQLSEAENHVPEEKIVQAEAKFETKSVQLPETLVEKIVTGIPFPQILKARQLSREWKSKFSQVATQAFDLIQWPHQYPAFYSKERYEIQGFDPVHNCVKRIEAVSTEAGDYEVKVAGYGALMVVLELNLVQPVAYVTNLLTRQTRKIPCPVEQRQQLSFCFFNSWPILVPLGPDGYELIIWFWNIDTPFVRENTSFMVYSSGSGTWITKFYKGDCLQSCSLGVFMDGSVYCIVDRARDLARIVRFNVKDGARTETQLINPDDIRKFEFLHCSIVRCASIVMVVVFEHDGCHLHVKMLRLDTESFTLLELSRMSDENASSPSSYDSDHPIVGSSNCVYILHLNQRRLITYDVNYNIWRSTDSIPEKFFEKAVRENLFVFEPQLNPYVVP